MMGYYDRAGEPITLEEWVRIPWDESTHRVARDVLPDGREVSTVWLGLDHNLTGEGPPLIFETMVFAAGSWDELSCERWATEADAVEGHAATVRRLLNAQSEG